MKPEWIPITGSNAGELRIGDRLMELGDFGFKIYAVVTSLPQLTGGQWTWTASAMSGGAINYMITVGLEHYGPEVYVARGEEDEPEQTNTDTEVPVNKQELVTVE